MENEKITTEKNMKPIGDHKAVAAIVMLLFFAFIIAADIFLIKNHDRQMSEAENRMLQQAPKLNMNTLTSGKFMHQFEDFVSDQFFGRNEWIQVKYGMDVLTGKKESNGVILGRDGYLIEKPGVVKRENIERNIAAINAFAESNPEINMVMSIVPNVSETCPQLVPSGADVRSQKPDFELYQSLLNPKVKYVDLSDTLKAHNTESLYYKGDHHWTSRAAEYAFEALAPYIGITKYQNVYNIYTVANDFSGTMASNSGAFRTMDSIEIFVATNINDYVVEYSDVNEKSATIYYGAALETKNKYEVFTGGNHPKIHIKTLSDNERNLLIFKDSYANCFIQFVLPYYNTITVIDPRYYSDNVQMVIEENQITDVLFLYNDNTFVEDNSLFGVLEN